MARKPVEMGGRPYTTLSLPTKLKKRIEEHGKSGEAAWEVIERALDVQDMVEAGLLKAQRECPSCGERVAPRATVGDVVAHFRANHTAAESPA